MQSLSAINHLLLTSSQHGRTHNRFQSITRRPKSKFGMKLRAISPKPEDGSVKNVASQSQSAASSTSFLSVLCPLLKFFGGGDPSQGRNELIEVATSSISSLARFPWGSRSMNDSGKNPMTSVNLQLYEFEACPFCRRVREAMTELDLSAEVYPCPKGSLRHREFVRKTGGKEQFPFLIDSSTGISLYESGDIVQYLFKQYGNGKSPSFGLLESTLLTGWVPTLLRAGRGMTLWNKAGKEPSQMLQLFSYENNPYARIVRETLCELELPYILQNAGMDSANSDLLFSLSGSREVLRDITLNGKLEIQHLPNKLGRSCLFWRSNTHNQVPYLVDPNTSFQSGDYKTILSYLFEAYSTDTSKVSA